MRTIGLLYPTPDSGEDDFVDLAARISPEIRLEIIYFPWPAGAEDLAALDLDDTFEAIRTLGSDTHLRSVLPAALEGREIDAVAFAVTSSSFLHGRDGVGHQLEVITEIAGVPATSTTHAFQQAVRQLGYSRVALASVYHQIASDHFIDRIEECGAEVIHRVDKNANSDRELAAWNTDRITDLVRESRHPRAEVVLLPETALHTAAIGDQLDAVAGVPVLTATQVTLWSACRLVGITQPTAPAAGKLFDLTIDQPAAEAL